MASHLNHLRYTNKQPSSILFPRSSAEALYSTSATTCGLRDTEGREAIQALRHRIIRVLRSHHQPNANNAYTFIMAVLRLLPLLLLWGKYDQSAFLGAAS